MRFSAVVVSILSSVAVVSALPIVNNDNAGVVARDDELPQARGLDTISGAADLEARQNAADEAKEGDNKSKQSAGNCGSGCKASLASQASKESKASKASKASKGN